MTFSEEEKPFGGFYLDLKLRNNSTVKINVSKQKPKYITWEKSAVKITGKAY